jgi:hypothetical protein
MTTSGRAAKTSVDLMHYPGLKGAEHRNLYFVAVLCTFNPKLDTEGYRRFGGSAAGRFA